MTEKKNFWKIIESRHSVRRFLDRPVDRALLETLIGAGVRAPNAHNRQSWRFVVLTDKADMLRLAEFMGKNYQEALRRAGLADEEVTARADKRAARLTAAPAAVVLCIETDDLDRYDDSNREDGEYLMAVQSAALAGGNILLAAEALGLGGVWMCAPLFAPERVREALDLPVSWMAQGILLLGYPREERGPNARKPLDEVVLWVE
ncbi:MAG: nitroreductase family protein [Anaerolineales bacterium]|jgi:F420 biosynthesis protein FbiB-like protein